MAHGEIAVPLHASRRLESGRRKPEAFRGGASLRSWGVWAGAATFPGASAATPWFRNSDDLVSQSFRVFLLYLRIKIITTANKKNGELPTRPNPAFYASSLSLDHPLKSNNAWRTASRRPKKSRISTNAVLHATIRPLHYVKKPPRLP